MREYRQMGEGRGEGRGKGEGEEEDRRFTQSVRGEQGEQEERQGRKQKIMHSHLGKRYMLLGFGILDSTKA